MTHADAKSSTEPGAFLTTRQAAELIGTVNSRTITSWLKKGLLPGQQINGRWYVSREGLIKLLNAHRTNGRQ